MSEKHAPTRAASLRKLVHAAFHLIDDGETDAKTEVTSIDNEIAAGDLREMAEALDELGIDSHEDIEDRFSLVGATEAKCDALVAQREADTDRMERATVAIESLNAECNKLSARCDSLVVENAALKRREEGAFNIATDRTEEHIRFQKQRDALVAALESIRCRSSALAKKTSVEIRQELHGIHADAVEAIAAIKTAMRAS